jgi:hypothetical protein
MEEKNYIKVIEDMTDAKLKEITKEELIFEGWVILRCNANAQLNPSEIRMILVDDPMIISSSAFKVESRREYSAESTLLKLIFFT